MEKNSKPRPEDISVCGGTSLGGLAAKHALRTDGPTTFIPASLSVVIPTLNEAAALPETIRRVHANPEVIQVIVADGGSTDDTCRIAKDLRCELITSPPGRGTQMRAGSALARGDAVLLLHADTWIPQGAARAALDCLSRPGVVAGGFWKEFRDCPWYMLGSKWRCAVRLRLGRRIAGDQGLFVLRSALEKIGGVPDVPLMEEFVLCARLRQLGRVALADAVVQTSARRFVERGVFRTYARMWNVTLRYWFGTPPAELQKLYERK